jgi:hypothetical protein
MADEYELYQEIFEITQWRDGCVYKTISLGTDWFDESVSKENIPSKTNLLYVAANDEFARTHMTIRKAR